MDPAEPCEAPSPGALSRLYLRLSFVNLLLIGCTALFVLFLWRDLGSSIDLLGEISDRTCDPHVLRAGTPLRFDEERSRPPENVIKSGYIGAEGSQAPDAAMMISVDVLRDGHPAAAMRFGDAAVLRPRGVHIVNFWAPWCRSCMLELPGLKALLSRRAADWADTVEFVPVKVLDAGNPQASYDKYADRMPTSRVRLADRSSDDALVNAMRVDPDRVLYRGELPVTLVFDCNRRVRWAEFAEIDAKKLADLEMTLDRLVAEAADHGPNSLCGQPWCGNGRCDADERTVGRGACPIDCGEPRATRPSPPVPPPADPIPPLPVVRRDDPPACPSDCARCDERGVCIARLQQRKNAPKPPAPTVEDPFCGDGTCDPIIGENNYSCCKDCPCEAPLRCQPATAGKFHCRADLRH